MAKKAPAPQKKGWFQSMVGLPYEAQKAKASEGLPSSMPFDTPIGDVEAFDAMRNGPMNDAIRPVEGGELLPKGNGKGGTTSELEGAVVSLLTWADQAIMGDAKQHLVGAPIRGMAEDDSQSPGFKPGKNMIWLQSFDFAKFAELMDVVLAGMPEGSPHKSKLQMARDKFTTVDDLESPEDVVGLILDVIATIEEIQQELAPEGSQSGAERSFVASGGSLISPYTQKPDSSYRGLGMRLMTIAHQDEYAGRVFGEVTEAGVGSDYTYGKGDRILVVQEVYPGSPAEQAGLCQYTKILEVSGERVFGDEYDEQATLRMLQARTVTLVVKKPTGSTAETVTLTAATITNPTKHDNHFNV